MPKRTWTEEERKAFGEKMKAAREAKLVQEPVEEKVIETKQKSGKSCLFCGKHTNLTRFVNLQTVAICEEHYYSKNIGQIAQRLREETIVHGSNL